MNGESYQAGMYIWFAFYFMSCLIFFGIAAWVIVRGGRDVWEMLTEARNNGRRRNR
jgi:hypothetical protein